MALYVIRANTNGSGAATGATAQPIRGFLQGVQVTLGGTPADTTDVTLTEETGLGRALLTLTDISASGYYNPQDEIDNTSGAAQDLYAPFYLNWTKVTLTVAQAVADTTDAVVVTLNIVGG
jgi:hypothetical protein